MLKEALEYSALFYEYRAWLKSFTNQGITCSTPPQSAQQEELEFYKLFPFGNEDRLALPLVSASAPSTTSVTPAVAASVAAA